MNYTVHNFLKRGNNNFLLKSPSQQRVEPKNIEVFKGREKRK